MACQSTACSSDIEAVSGSYDFHWGWVEAIGPIRPGGVHLHRVRDDSRLHELGAVGLAGLDGLQAIAGTGDGAGAVVTTAVAGTGLDGAGERGSDEREDNGGLHLDGLCVCERDMLVQTRGEIVDCGS